MGSVANNTKNREVYFDPEMVDTYDFRFCPTRLDNNARLDDTWVLAAIYTSKGSLNEMQKMLGRRRGIIHDFIFSNYAVLQHYRDVLDSNAEIIRDELRSVALSNIADYYESNEEGEPVLRLPNVNDPDYRKKMSAVSELVTEDFEGGRRGLGKRVKFKLYPKLPAIQALLGDKTQEVLEEINSSETKNLTLSFRITSVPSGKFVPAPSDTNDRPAIEVDYSEET